MCTIIHTIIVLLIHFKWIFIVEDILFVVKLIYVHIFIMIISIFFVKK